MECINEIFSLVWKRKRVERRKKRYEKERAIKGQLKKLKEEIHLLRERILGEENENLEGDIEKIRQLTNKVKEDIKEELISQNVFCRILNFLFGEQDLFLSVFQEYEETLKEFEKCLQEIEREIDSKEKEIRKKEGSEYLHPEKCRSKKGNKTVKRVEELFKIQKIVYKLYEDYISIIPFSYRNRRIRKRTQDGYLEVILNPYELTKNEENFYKMLEENNKKFILKEMERLEEKDFWRERLKDGSYVKLDEFQKEAVLLDPPQLLIKAGAGSGKTKVLLKKYEYLIKEKNVPPENIILLSFQRKVSKEIEKKIREDLELKDENIRVSTFHALGGLFWRRTQRINENKITKILDESVKKIEKGLRNEDITKIYLYKRALEYILNKTKESSGEIYEIDLSDITRSKGEETILEFLLEHDIIIKNDDEQWKIEWDYEEEAKLQEEKPQNREFTLVEAFTIFPHKPKRQNKKEKQREISVLPDFTLRGGGLKILWEHVGIEWEGEKDQKRITPQEYYEKYKKKKRVYKLNGIPVIETFYKSLKEKENKEERKREIKRILKKQLKKIYKKIYGSNIQVIIERLSKDEFNKRKEKYLRHVKELLQKAQKIKFIQDFINFSDNMLLNDEEIKKRLSRDVKSTAIAELLLRIKNEYKKKKEKENMLDYSDLITETVELIRKEPERVKHLEYILVDEFQDINPQRYELLKELIDKSEAKLVVIGDDLQAIMGFTGASKKYFTHFEEYFYGKRILNEPFLKECIKKEHLKYNYRNPQRIVEYTKCRFKKQIEGRSDKEGLITIAYSPANAIESIQRIIKQQSSAEKNRICILFRSVLDLEWFKNKLDQKYTTLKRVIEEEIEERKNGTKNFKKEKEMLRVKWRMKHLDLYIETIHSMKGLEVDWVIVPHVTLQGFPDYYKRKSTFLSPLVYGSEKEKEDEEESLLYVALTRALEGVILVTEKGKENDVIRSIQAFQERDNKSRTYHPNLLKKERSFSIKSSK